MSRSTKQKKGSMKKLRSLIAVGMMSVSLWAIPVHTPQVQAFDGQAAGQILGQVLGIAMNYNYIRDAFLLMGDDPVSQSQILQADIEQQGRDMTPRNNEVVDRVMKQLIERGDYALKSDNLPFRWIVNNNSNVWNAACYPHDFVTVNKCLVEDLKWNEDMIAGVLGHEMIHGLHHHVANGNANNYLTGQIFGLLSGGINYDYRDLYKKLTQYITMKNVSVPMENEADEYGFYLMTSAGFNPGGFVLEILHMIEQNIASNNTKPSDIAEIMSGQIWSHPSDQNRIQNAKKWFSLYGYNHVDVRNVDEIYVDDQFLLKAVPEGDLTSWENAYLIAGGLAKGIHDYRLATLWSFQEKANGTVDFLNNDRVYQPLKKAVQEAHLERTLEEMLTKAYASDSQSGNRDKIYMAEYNRKEEIKKEREKAAAKSEELSNHYSAKASKYNDMGLASLAVNEAHRALTSNENNSNAYMELGRACSLENGHEKALEYFDKTIALAPNNGFAYMYKGLSLYALGREDEAINELNQIGQIKTDKTLIINSLQLMARMQDEKGYEEDALQSYRKLLKLYPEFAVPEKYANRMNG